VDKANPTFKATTPAVKAGGQSEPDCTNCIS
jgi:hypothetical protein